MINSYTHVWTGTGWLTPIPLVLKLMHLSRQVLGFYTNTCWAPHNEVSPERFTVTTTAISSLRLLSSRMPLWMSDCSFTQRVLNSHWSCYSAVWLLHVWCHVKPLPSRRKLCTPYNHVLDYSVILFEAIYAGCMCVQLKTATCTFGRMTRILYVLLR